MAVHLPAGRVNAIQCFKIMAAIVLIPKIRMTGLAAESVQQGNESRIRKTRKLKHIY